MKQAVAGTVPAASYSPGIVSSGRLVHVSGQGPLVDGEVVEGTIEQQTELTLENLAAVLAAAGTSPVDVVRCTVYLQDLDDFDAMDRVYARFFPAPLPARTTIGCELRGIKVEIDCVAAVGE